MKKWLFVIAMVGLLAYGDVLIKDSLDPEQTNIKEKTGEIKGYLKRDTLDRDRINIYDQYGNQKGYLKKDMLSPDTWNFREKRNPIYSYFLSKPFGEAVRPKHLGKV